MPLNQAKTDANHEPTALGVTDDVAALVSAIICDPITDRVLINISMVNAENDVVATQLREDANHSPVATAVTDDANQDIRLIKVSPLTGRLLIDILLI